MNEHDLNYYMALPYTVVIRRDDDGDYVARIEELQGCVAHGGTPDEALGSLVEVQSAWLEEAISSERTIPEPVREENLPSGKWVQRVPRSLHRKLTKIAKKESVSLNHLVSAILAEAAGTPALTTSAQVSVWEEARRSARWELIDTGQTSRAGSLLLTELDRVTKIQEKGTASAKKSHAKTEKFEYLQ